MQKSRVQPSKNLPLNRRGMLRPATVQQTQRKTSGMREGSTLTARANFPRKISKETTAFSQIKR